MDLVLVAVIALGAIGLVSSTVLYVCSKKFAVKEDARIGEVAELLPQANCGGCGFAGCAGLADALVKGADAGSIEGLFCPVGGQEVMGKVVCRRIVEIERQIDARSLHIDVIISGQDGE